MKSVERRLVQEILFPSTSTIQKVLFAWGNVGSIRMTSHNSLLKIAREELGEQDLGGTITVHQGGNVGLRLKL